MVEGLPGRNTIAPRDCAGVCIGIDGAARQRFERVRDYFGLSRGEELRVRAASALH
jgi:hypothetical protein